jgi:hypothetical protein
MKKIAVTIIGSCLMLFGNAQGFHPEINVGLAIRGSSTQLKPRGNVLHPYDFFYNSTRQFRSNSLALGIAHEIFNKNWRVELSNYCRYNYFREINETAPSSTTPIIRTEKRFKTDHFLDFYYNPTIDKKKIWKIKLGLGYGIMNTGTGFTYKRFTGNYDSSGNPIFVQERDTFGFSSWHAMIGAAYKKLNATITVNQSKDNNNEYRPSIWIETKFAYQFTL